MDQRQSWNFLTSERSEEVPFLRGVRRGKSTGGHLRSEIVRGKSGRTNCRRATKLGPKVRLFKTPVRIVLQPDRAHAARAIACEAHKNARFRNF